MNKKIALILTAFIIAGALCSCTTEETTVETTTADTTTEAITEVTTESTGAEPTATTNGTRKNMPKSPNTPEIEGYNLVWSDEFDGDKLDEESWSVAFARSGANNNELQSYVISDSNVFVKDGKLHLKALKDVNENGEVTYTSGKVFSENRADFTYGKVVVSAKVPEGRGLWPAIWMMPSNGGKYGSWPRSGEIDIMEILGQDTKTTYSTIHYGNPHQQQQGKKVLTDTSYAEDFHEYSVEWKPGELKFFVDGEEIACFNEWYSSNGKTEKEFPAPFDRNFYLILNLAVGGDWPGDPDEKTDFKKADFEIDYVRVYQLAE